MAMQRWIRVAVDDDDDDQGGSGRGGVGVGAGRRARRRELAGWYAYGIAAEIFAVCGLGSFLPVTLEQLARENGVLDSDGKTPCWQPASAHQPGLQARESSSSVCVVHLLGLAINTSSFALYTFSAAVLAQALLLVSIGAIADHGSNRKRLLLTLGLAGAASCALFIFVSPAVYLIGVGLTIVSIACLGSSIVLQNSFLPLLTRGDPPVYVKTTADSSTALDDITSEEEHGRASCDEQDISGLLNRSRQNYRVMNPSVDGLILSNKVSSKGIGMGYTAAVAVQLLSITIILLYSKLAPSLASTTLPLRTVLLMVGCFWAMFTIPTALWLREAAGPPLPMDQGRDNGYSHWLQYIIFAWKSLWQTIKKAAKLRQVVLYLIGWFLLSDGIATISGTAILFAKTELQLGTAAIAMLSITATASGVAGATAWPMIERRFNLKSTSIVLICVALLELIPLYGLTGLLPVVKALGVGGLQQKWEIFPLGFLLGFVMGGISSYSRSIYGLMIPPGMEASFYALFAVTDKGSSVIGPAIVGRIIDATGTIRSAFWFLSILILTPLPFFYIVDFERGRQNGLAMAGESAESQVYDEVSLRHVHTAD